MHTSFALGRGAVALLLAGAGLVLGVTACNVTLSNAPCVSVPSAPSYYPAPAARADSTSMNFGLTSDYVSAVVKPAVETNSGPSGVHVRSVVLSEQGTGASAVNLLTLTIVPWLQGTGGQPAEVNRPFDLALKITPYLVNRKTVSDQATRSKILGSSVDAGLVLWFDFVGLRDDGSGAQVTCAAADYVSSRVLNGVLTHLGAQQPLVIATGNVESIADTLLNSTTHVNGVNIGSDGTLKLGFAFDNLPATPGVPAARPFDPETYTEPFLYPIENWDWMLDIDQGFFDAALQTRVNALLGAAAPGAMVTGVTPAFTGNGYDQSLNQIGLSINGTAPSICGSFNFTVTTTVMPQIAVDSNGNSVLQAPISKPNFDPGTGQGFKAFCYAAEQAFFSLNTGHILPSKPATGCADVIIDPAALTTKSGDTLYGIGVDTEFDFVVLGRSKLLDQELGTRTTVPACTPA